MQLLDQTLDDMNRLGQVLTSSPLLTHTLENLTIPRDELESTLRALSDELGLQSITTSFLALLAQMRRTKLLAEIIENFANLVRTRQNKLKVHVTSHSKLSPAQMDRMGKALSTATGKKIVLDVTTKEDILGGVIVNYGSYKLDFSLKSKLNELKHELERLS